jgi:hypothetical protein
VGDWDGLDRVLERLAGATSAAEERGCEVTARKRRRDQREKVATVSQVPPQSLAMSIVEATTVAAIRHPIATMKLFDGCIDLAFKSRLRTLAQRPDSIGVAAKTLLEQITTSEQKS